MRNKVMILICEIAAVYGLTCDETLEMPADKRLSLRELQTMLPKEIVQCLAHLGKEKLEDSEGDFIWKTLITFFEGIPNIPDNVLILLHWVTPAITPEEYTNITFNSIDIIQNFGLNYGLSADQLYAIADRVKEDYAGKEPEDYTYYDLAALRQILCAYNKSEILRIHPAAYRETATIIGKLEKCSPDVLSGFASLAVQRSAFGSPETWSEAVLDIIGVVADYIPKQITEKIRSHPNAN